MIVALEISTMLVIVNNLSFLSRKYNSCVRLKALFTEGRQNTQQFWLLKTQLNNKQRRPKLRYDVFNLLCCSRFCYYHILASNVTLK